MQEDLSPLGIQIASDLHIEFFFHPDALPEDEDTLWSVLLQKQCNCSVLALLGDIGVLSSDELRGQYTRFVSWCAARWDHVLLLTGNHEYYCRSHGPNNSSTEVTDYASIDAFLFSMCTSESMSGKVHFLQKGIFKLGDVTVLGCTLWSHVCI